MIWSIISHVAVALAVVGVAVLYFRWHASQRRKFINDIRAVAKMKNRRVKIDPLATVKQLRAKYLKLCESPDAPKKEAKTQPAPTPDVPIDPHRTVAPTPDTPGSSVAEFAGKDTGEDGSG
jgi:hypothetical protein